MQHARGHAVPRAMVFGAMLVITLSSLLAFLYGSRLVRSLDRLTSSAVRITAGDYTQPVEILRRDELGNLERTVEQMRQRLAQTTITQELPLQRPQQHGRCRLRDGQRRHDQDRQMTPRAPTGQAEEDLVGRQIAHAAGKVLRAHRQSRPCSMRAKSARRCCAAVTGQTIPVSFSGSDIATENPQFAGCIFVARDITDRKRAERRIRYLARYDALTKIPNRMQFQHLLQQAIARSLRSGNIVAMLYLDMDRFKEVNDTFGHSAGDRVLEVLTERLTAVLPAGTVIGRLAGDEFALFIDGLSQPEARSAVRQLSDAILQSVGQAFHVNQQEVFLTVSIGAAFCPRDAENVIDLIRNADAAMYYSKQNGGNSCVFYSPDMNAAAVERLMLKSKLKRALERDELVIRYMPKVDLTDGRIVGSEALLRWRLPGHGDIPPSQFIPLAEENNLILGCRRMGPQPCVHGLPCPRGACARPGTHSAESLSQAAPAGEFHPSLPLGFRTPSRFAAESGTGNHRDHTHGGSEAHDWHAA